MIWIKTTTGTLCLAADELRTIHTEVQRVGGREKSFLALTLKSGERYLISTGDDELRNAEMDRQFQAAFRAAASSTWPEPTIDLDKIMRESGDPPYMATVLISGKEAGELLSRKQSKPRQFKVLRARDRQISIDPCDTDLSKTSAYFIFDDERHETGVISKKAYDIAHSVHIWPCFLSEPEEEEDASPIRIGREYCIRLRTGAETYLIRTGNEEAANERWLRIINDWLAGDERLLDLTVSDGDDVTPLLVSREETPEMLKYLREYGGVCPILP